MSKGKLRAQFTDEVVKRAVIDSFRKDQSIDYINMATLLNDNEQGAVVSPELCRYWATQFDDKKKNGDDYATLAKANKKIKDSRVLRSASPEDDKTILKGAAVRLARASKSILVIPDQHAPYHHLDTIEFLKAVAKKYKPDTVINLGDETDGHGLSFHDSDPNLDSAGMELAKARIFMSELEVEFPTMKICHSNHGSLIYRKSKVHGIPVEMIKSYREILFPEGNGKGWEWDYEHVIDLPNGDKVMFKHQASGDLLAAAAHERCNLVIGHLHGKYAINYAASKSALYWGMNGGCLIDAKSMAFSYGSDFKNKPIIGCSVIVDSLPILVPMRLNSEGRWIKQL